MNSIAASCSASSAPQGRPPTPMIAQQVWLPWPAFSLNFELCCPAAAGLQLALLRARVRARARTHRLIGPLQLQWELEVFENGT